MKNNNVVKNDKKFNLNRPITGVIQNDRIWEQWYDPKKMNENLPKMNQADYEEMCNKDYPNDESAASNEYFIGSAAHTAPRVTGSTVNSAYTSKTFILNITNPNTIYHVMVNHWNVPTSNVKKGGGLFIDANQRGRVVCPISFWMQILALGPITS